MAGGEPGRYPARRDLLQPGTDVRALSRDLRGARMAGIGFEFRKLLQKDTYWGIFQAYGYSGVVSSGPWILSIIGILIVGIYSAGTVSPAIAVVQFQVSITYLFMASLILTGFVQ